MAASPVHPLLGCPAEEEAWSHWNREFRLDCAPWLVGHRVFGTIVMPAACFAEMACAAAKRNGLACASDLNFWQPLFLNERAKIELWTRVDPQSGNLEIHSRAQQHLPWICHATGRLISGTEAAKGIERLPLDEIRKRCTQTAAAGLYDRFRTAGIDYQNSFVRIFRFWRGHREALALIDPGEAGEWNHYLIFPPVLDAGFQVLLGATSDTHNRPGVPRRIEHLALRDPVRAQALYSYARLKGSGEYELQGDLWLANEEGEALVEIRGFTCRYLS
jgi:acyl transferase domain-containing protein